MKLVSMFLNKVGYSKLIFIAVLGGLYCWINHEEYVEYAEEVMLGDPPTLEVIRRREVLALRVNQLKPRWSYIRSEVFLFGQKQPVWSGRLRPLYLEKLPNDEGYLMVAGVDNGWECSERKSIGLDSYYVTIKINPAEGVTEVATPARLEGKPSNLLFRWGNIPNGMERVSVAEKTRLNGLYYKPEPYRANILLATKQIGC